MTRAVDLLHEAIRKATVTGYHGSRERRLSIRTFKRGTSFATAKPLANHYAGGKGGKRYEVKIDTKGFKQINVPKGADAVKYLQRARAARAPGVRIKGLPDGAGLRDRSEQMLVNDASRVKRQRTQRVRKARSFFARFL